MRSPAPAPAIQGGIVTITGTTIIITTTTTTTIGTIAESRPRRAGANRRGVAAAIVV